MATRRFCPESCLWHGEDPCSAKDCHHQTDVVYRTPVKATIKYREEEPIEILGENTRPVCVAYDQPIGQTWYVRNARGEESGIMYQNPLVTIQGSKNRR